VGAAPQGLHDTINVTNSTAGATFLEQGYGPTMPGCDGDGNVIYVQDDPDAVAVPATTGLFSLTIDQQGTGAAGSPGQTILVGNVSPVEVALTGPGIFAEQNDGAGSGTGKGSSPNVIHIESITVYGHLTNSFGPLGPPSIVTSQGDGSGDSTTIDSSTVWGNISASQGNGDGDTAYLAADTAGYTTPGVGGVLIPHYGLVTVSQGDGDGCIIFFTSFGSEYEALNVFNNLVTTQGDGAGDNTTIDSTDVVTGNIIVFQGNGAGDCVYILASTAGYTTPDGPLVTDHGGLLAVCQGNGYEDCIIINSTGFEYPTLGDFGSVFNNVLLVQGDGLNGLPVDCLEPTGPIIIIDETIIWSELWIFQNAVLRLDGGLTASNVASLNMDDAPPVTTDGPGLGNNVVDIGTGVLFGVPYDPPLPIPGIGPVLFENPGVVFVDTTYIYQGGANNTVVMGGSGGGAGGPDFETGTLDIWTGDGGGGTVYAINTTVEFGSFFGWNYVISGGGTGNTFIDAGNNFENGNNTLTTGPGY